MARTFVSDPRDVVKSGAVVRVKVLEVDEARQRIALTLRLDDEPGAAAGRGEQGEGRGRGPRDGQAGGRRQGDGPRGGDRREGQRGGDRRDGQRGGDRREGQRSGDRGRAAAPAGNSAMADALRRAGLTDDKKR
jgi:uncharacterized protein